MDKVACGRIGHDWHQTGSHWVPVPAAYTFPEPMPNDHEVEYLDFECRRCGQKHSEERLYSKRPQTRKSGYSTAKAGRSARHSSASLERGGTTRALPGDSSEQRRPAPKSGKRLR